MRPPVSSRDLNNETALSQRRLRGSAGCSASCQLALLAHASYREATMKPRILLLGAILLAVAQAVSLRCSLMQATGRQP
jgi:hypothetical protein